MQKKKKQSEASKIFEYIERGLFYPANSNHQKYLATNKHGEIRHYAFKKTYRPRGLPPQVEYVNSISLDNPRLRNPINVLQPLKNTLRGIRHFGIVKNADSKTIPWLAGDVDRHSYDISPEEHLWLCEIVYDEFSKLTDYFFHLEVNRKNGSAKFFAFHKEISSIPVKVAESVGDQIQKRIYERSGKWIEVFGSSVDHRCMLPLNPEKIYLTDSGQLDKCEKYYYGNCYKTEWGWFSDDELNEMAQNTCNRFAFRDSLGITEVKRKRIYYSCYDTVDFYHAYNRKGTIGKTEALHWIKKISTLSYQPNPSHNRVSVTKGTKTEQRTDSLISSPAPSISTASKNRKPTIAATTRTERFLDAIDKLKSDPDSRRRQHGACLELSRNIRRVPSVGEAMDFIKEHDLFTGKWNNPKRERRVKGILGFISRTFDAGKCGSGKSFNFDPEKSGAYEWAEKKFQTNHVAKHESHQGLRIDPTTLAVTGDGRVYKRNAKVSVREIAQYFELMEECRKTSKHGDGGIPEDRAEEMWTCLFETEQVETAWNSHRFRYVRDLLHGLGILACDYIKTRNKSYCYKVGKYHPFEKQWKQEANISQASKKPCEMISTAPQPMKLPSFSINIFTEKSTVEADVPELVSCCIETNFSSASPSHQYKHNTEGVDNLSVFEEVRQNDLLNRPPP